jgi:NAD(P)-dependent dehydrogenase (short-subunit alcohol dehydrogenase family)
MTLKEKHALVTGSSRGIGRGIALKLAERGARVAVHYYQNEDAAKSTLAKSASVDRMAFWFKPMCAARKRSAGFSNRWKRSSDRSTSLSATLARKRRPSISRRDQPDEVADLIERYASLHAQ